MYIADSILLRAWVFLLLVILFSVPNIQAFENYFLRPTTSFFFLMYLFVLHLDCSLPSLPIIPSASLLVHPSSAITQKEAGLLWASTQQSCHRAKNLPPASRLGKAIQHEKQVPNRAKTLGTAPGAIVRSSTYTPGHTTVTHM